MMAFTSLQPNLTPLFLLLTAVTIVCLSKIGGLKSGSRLENSDGTHLSNDSVRDLFEVEVGSTPEKHFCFKDMCTCTRDKADCSRNYGNLTFVPRFANNIRTLNFSNNELSEIEHDDFFLNVTNVTTLDLSSNGLHYLSRNVFRPLKNLVCLYFDQNVGINYTTLIPVFSVTKLWLLSLRRNELGPLPSELFTRYQLPHLGVLLLFHNNLGPVNLTDFEPLGNLTQLDLARNIMSRFIVEDPTKLDVLNLEQNGLFVFPNTCIQNSSLFPNLKKLDLKQNLIDQIPKRVCLPSLQFLILSHNLLAVLKTDMFSPDRFPSLVLLHLDAMNTQIQIIEEYVFRNPAIETVTLMYNNIDFSLTSIDSNAFAGCPQLHRLQLSHNYFNLVNDTRFRQLFGSIDKLHVLLIGITFIEVISVATFSSIPSLKQLYLYDNQLANIPDGAFDELHNLTHLYLGGNVISVIRETTFSAATRKRLSHLDLSGNTFSCSCDVLWFQEWLKSDPSLFDKPYYTYVCDDDPQTPIVSFELPAQACLLSHEANAFVIMTTSLALFCLTVFSTLYRYRWHIRLVLYEAFRGGVEARRRRLENGRFQYDVFVSFDADDLLWVRERLVPQLEHRLQLRLCLHDRDFIPGRNIIDNIEECVETSKKVLMVFSPAFARSEWCQFELALCLRHAMDNDDVLVVALLEDIPPRDLTPAMKAVMKTTTYIQWADMKAVMKTTTYIQWADEPDAVASFWGRMEIALEEILPAV